MERRPGSVRPWALWLLACTLPSAALAAPVAGMPAPESFETKTQTMEELVAKIASRVKEIDNLRTVAIREGAAVKLVCINEKLRRLREARDTSNLVRNSWQLARENRGLADRHLERLRILQLLANTIAEEAYLCIDARTAAVTLMKIESSVPESPPGPDVVRPPVVERPPLASPF